MPTTRPGYIWSGTEWVAIGQEAVVAPVSYQTSAPSTPATGDIWIDSDDDVPGIDTSQFLRWRETAVGGETSLSGNDDTGLPLRYTPGYEQVYINGVLQVRGQDYIATTGTTITGLLALAANDVVEVFGVVARTVGDVYTQAQTNSLLDAKSNVSTTGLVLLNTTTFTTVASTTIDNVFTSTYANYRVDLYVKSVSDNNVELRFNYRSAVPADLTTNGFMYYGTIGSGSAIVGGSSTSFGWPLINNSSANMHNCYSMTLFEPSNTVSKKGVCQHNGTGFVGGATQYITSSISIRNEDTTAATGLKFAVATGTFSGIVRIYGIR